MIQKPYEHVEVIRSGPADGPVPLAFTPVRFVVQQIIKGGGERNREREGRTRVCNLCGSQTFLIVSPPCVGSFAWSDQQAVNRQSARR